ncbi:MAG: Sec-independent protein translocase subunit TatA/TatB [Planctomycetaceae bacterium]
MSTPLAFGQIGFWQIVIILFVVLLLFGANRLPRLARSLGSSLTEFKKGLKEGDADEASPRIQKESEEAKSGSPAEKDSG